MESRKLLVSIFNRNMGLVKNSGPDDPSASLFIVTFNNSDPQMTEARLSGLIPYARFIAELDGRFFFRKEKGTETILEQGSELTSDYGCIKPDVLAKLLPLAKEVNFDYVIMRLILKGRSG